MPMITVRYVTPNDRPELLREIAVLASQMAAEHLHKDPDVTAVLVEPADGAGWFVAGRRPTEDGLSAFWLDIKITDGTNVKSDTAAFIAAVFGSMKELLGPLHEESYVLVHAANGDEYGFGGRTQNARWAAAHPG
jgi:4-oxalocrotonate tautomerase